MAKLLMRLRRPLRFSLATLLIVTTIFSLWLGYISQRAKSQARSVSALTKSGANIQYDYQVKPEGGYSVRTPIPGPDWLRKIIGDDYFRRAVFVVGVSSDEQMRHLEPLGELQMLMGGGEVTDAGLQSLTNLSELKSIGFKDSKLTDAGLTHLRKLKHLEVLSLTGNQITGKGFEHFRELDRLETLFLYENPIDDEGLAHLPALSSLKKLGIAHTPVTDKGLKAVRPLKNLEYLCLSGEGITDAGLIHLEGLSHLSRLELLWTRVTDEAVAALQKKLPNCEIVK